MPLGRHQTSMPTADEALPGRDHRPFAVPEHHAVLGNPIEDVVPEGMSEAVVGMGCFWGAERVFWETSGVWSTAVGYAGGVTRHPTYEEVCTGRTGHAEVVRVVFDPAIVSYTELLKVFWENHDPTQGMRQGNDIGTQYRSVILVRDDEQRHVAEESRQAYQGALNEHGIGSITTQTATLEEFWYAEDYHQQYLAKNPLGYCGIGGTGVSCPVGLGVDQHR